MRTSEHINAAWTLAREGSPDGERLRRRVGAIGALSLLVCGFLASIGLGVVVLAALGAVVVSVGVVVLAALWPRVSPRVGQALVRTRSSGRGARAQLTPLWRKASGTARTAAGSARSRASSVAGDVARSTRAMAIRFAPRPARAEPQREALRLNAEGTQHRRHGRYDAAVDCHRRALEILRDLGDRRTVALTQSNLALALSHAGDDESAIELFEEAAAALRDLGDSEHEAQVMANLGLVHRRHGRREEGDNVLELALSKLSPESSAYHTIEAELRRAS
jgi:tetratricopeptide (TPR) repeat protein